MNLSSNLRVGTVPFSNALPLSRCIAETLGGGSLTRAVPSTLGPMLAAGGVDVALLSTIELKRNPEYGYIPGMGVCSDGPVRSVILWTRRDPGELDRIALDANSLSSNRMLKILLRDYWNIEPDLVPYDPPLENGLAIADAALTIGDSSFIAPPPGIDAIDLGAVWKDHIGLPFVYAVWITRPGLDPNAIAEPFETALEKGLARRRELADECARLDPLNDAEFYYRYMTGNIHYKIGPREEEGLARYLSLAE